MALRIRKKLRVQLPSELYLSAYWQEDEEELPDISLNAIFWATGKIGSLCKQAQGPDKERRLGPCAPEAAEYREWNEYEDNIGINETV